MKHYNCRCNPAEWERIAESVNKWAKAKGVDPKHVFAAIDRDIPTYEQYRTDDSYKPPLRLVVKGQINTLIFEEAEIVE